MSSDSNTPANRRSPLLNEIRYSLKELMEEVRLEREGSSIGQEIVDQSEIGKLFRTKKKARRGKHGE